MNELKEKYTKRINKYIKKNNKLLSELRKRMVWGFQSDDVTMVVSSGGFYTDFRTQDISTTEMREKPIADEIIKQTNRLISLFINNPSNLEFGKEGDSYHLRQDGIVCSFSEESFFISYKVNGHGHVIYEIYFNDSELDKNVDKNLIEEFQDLYKKLRYKYSEDVIELIRQKMH